LEERKYQKQIKQALQLSFRQAKGLAFAELQAPREFVYQMKLENEFLPFDYDC